MHRLLVISYWIFLALSSSSGRILAQAPDVAPVVHNVEPPNWWAKMPVDRIQLMVYGEHLDGITARFAEPELRVLGVSTLPNSTYSFIDIEISDEAPAGVYTLVIARGEAATSVEYPIHAREVAGNRHQGFGVEDVIYLITPDRFANGLPENDVVPGIRDDFDPSQHHMRHGGDLQGLIDRLGYLEDLGVTALWLNPILENDVQNSYHGYQATDLYRIDPRYGSNADFKRLVDEAHRRGLKIIFDHVNNHIGIGHPWVDNPPMDDWFNGAVDRHASSKHYKMAPADPHADPYSDELLKTFWFVDSMPDLNQRNPFLARYRIQNTLWWIEYSGMDGIREDTYPYSDQAFLAEWAKTIRSVYPEFNIVGEIWETKPAYLSLFQKRSRLPRDFETHLPAIMDFPLAEAFRNYLTGDGELEDIYKVLAQDFVYTDLNNIMTLFDNHDMARGIYIAEGDVPRLKQVLTMLLTMRGIPQLLYGTEINMVGGESHVELRADFPGGFPGHERDAFTAAGRTDEENAIFEYTRSLLHLRKKHKALTHGRTVHYPTPDYRTDIYVYLRIYNEDKILVVVNGHDEARIVQLEETRHWFSGPPTLEDAWTGEKIVLDESMTLSIPARGIAVYEAR